MRVLGYFAVFLGSLSVVLSVVELGEEGPGEAFLLLTFGLGLYALGIGAISSYRYRYRGGAPSVIGALFLFLCYIGLAQGLADYIWDGELVTQSEAVTVAVIGLIGLILMLSGHRAHRERAERDKPAAITLPPAGASTAASAASMLRPVELRLGTTMLLRRQNMLGFGVPLAIWLFCTGVLISMSTDKSVWEFAADLAGSIFKPSDMSDRFHLGLLGLAVFGSAVSCYSVRLGRMRITPEGIEGYMPRWTQLVATRLSRGRFRLRWDEILEARLDCAVRGPTAPRVNAARLLLRTAERGEYRFSPFGWIVRGGPDHRLTLREAFASNTSITELLGRAPLVDALRQRGFELQGSPAAAKDHQGFDLLRHRGMLTLLVLIAVIGGYALIDGLFAVPYHPLESLPLAPFIAIGLIALAVAYRAGGDAPPVERAVVGALAVAAVIAATYPTLLRYNAWTGTSQTLVFVSEGGGRFQSEVPHMPSISLGHMQVNEYWEAHPPGSTHTFVLVKGAAGFYQLDERPLLEGTRRFYAESSD